MNKLLLLLIAGLTVFKLASSDDVPATSDALLKSLARRDTDILDLAKVGTNLVHQHGATNAYEIVRGAWDVLGKTNATDKAKDVVWLSSQPPRVRDIAWMLAYSNEWLHPLPPIPPPPSSAPTAPKPVYETNREPAMPSPELESVKSAREEKAKADNSLRNFFEGVRFGALAQQRNLDDHDINIIAQKAYNLWQQSMQQQRTAATN